MKTTSGVKTSYNAQIAVDEECMIITANDVVKEASDVNQLDSMVDQSMENTGQKMKELSADSGYSSGENLKKLEQKAIDAYIPDREYQSNIRKGKDPKENQFDKENFSYDEEEDTFTCPEGKKLHFSCFQKRKGKEPLRVYQCFHCQECSCFNQCTKNKNGRTISRHPHEKELKAMRKKLDSKEGKAIYAKRKKVVEPVFGTIKTVIGFTSFSLRGSVKVKGEFNLVSISYNLRKIASCLRRRQKYAFSMINSIQYQPI